MMKLDELDEFVVNSLKKVIEDGNDSTEHKLQAISILIGFMDRFVPVEDLGE